MENYTNAALAGWGGNDIFFFVHGEHGVEPTPSIKILKMSAV